MQARLEAHQVPVPVDDHDVTRVTLVSLCAWKAAQNIHARTKSGAPPQTSVLRGLGWFRRPSTSGRQHQVALP